MTNTYERCSTVSVFTPLICLIMKLHIPIFSGSLHVTITQTVTNEIRAVAMLLFTFYKKLSYRRLHFLWHITVLNLRTIL